MAEPREVGGYERVADGDPRKEMPSETPPQV